MDNPVFKVCFKPDPDKTPNIELIGEICSMESSLGTLFMDLEVGDEKYHITSDQIVYFCDPAEVV